MNVHGEWIFVFSSWRWNCILTGLHKLDIHGIATRSCFQFFKSFFQNQNGTIEFEFDNKTCYNMLFIAYA